MIIIQSYLKENYNSVKEILKEAESFDELWDSEENVTGMIEKDKESVLVAMDEDKVVGVLYIIFFGTKVANIFRLAVKKEYRNRGIATSLIERAEVLLKNNGVKEIGMYVDTTKTELQTFYEKKDFNSSTGKAYVYMWKRID